METWRHGHGHRGVSTWRQEHRDMEIETRTWTWRHTWRYKHGDRNMETRTWTWRRTFTWTQGHGNGYGHGYRHRNGHGHEKLVSLLNKEDVFYKKSTKVKYYRIEVTCTTLENHENSESRTWNSVRGISSNFPFAELRGIQRNLCQFRRKYGSKKSGRFTYRPNSADTLSHAKFIEIKVSSWHDNNDDILLHQ